MACIASMMVMVMERAGGEVDTHMACIASMMAMVMEGDGTCILTCHGLHP